MLDSISCFFVDFIIFPLVFDSFHIYLVAIKKHLFFLPVIILGFILLPITLILSLLRNFANRACMLEDLGVLEAYRRGFEVLGDNFGPAVVVFLIQIALSIGIGVMMLIPGILIALCCLLWPLLLLVQGAFSAYYSTLWTLAWREWTGMALLASEAESKSPDKKETEEK